MKYSTPNSLQHLLSIGKFDIPDESAMQAFGTKLAHLLTGSTLITLSGELGAGKSVLVRAMIHALGYEGRVKSPTYTLIELYDIGCHEHLAPECAGQTHLQAAHLDLYRLADPDELDYLGFTDLLVTCNLILIEWPEKGEGRLPKADLHVDILYTEEGARELTIAIP